MVVAVMMPMVMSVTMIMVMAAAAGILMRVCLGVAVSGNGRQVGFGDLLRVFIGHFRRSSIDNAISPGHCRART